MQKIEAIGVTGVKGWSLDPVDLEEYRESVGSAWALWTYLWSWFRPVITEKRIAFTRTDGGLSILTPDPVFFFLLRRGGVIRHMRVVDEGGTRGFPIFEGTGEILGSMTEDEALDFMVWRDVPHGTNHIAFIDHVPEDRTNRNAWALSDSGSVALH